MAADKKKARRRKATVMFVDESGFSVVPHVGKTWAPKGQTPIIKHRMSWKKLSSISGVTPEGKFFMSLRRGVIDSEGVVEFLRGLLRHIRGNILIVWDNIGIHKSARVRQWIKVHPRIQTEPLPTYAPELNPDEGVWQHLKNVALANFCPDDESQLERQIKKSARSMRRRTVLIQSFYHHTRLG